MLEKFVNIMKVILGNMQVGYFARTLTQLFPVEYEVKLGDLEARTKIIFTRHNYVRKFSLDINFNIH